MKTKIIDNWLSKDLQEYMERLFLYHTPHWWDMKPFIGKPPFYYCNLNMEDAFYAFLGEKALRTIGKGSLRRMYINVQHPGMDGSYHVDDGKITGIYMVTKTLSKSGKLLIDGEKDISFIQGRFVMFNAKTPHKANSPSKGNVRISLAFKTE
tara:strand:- start:1899 stop:2354 length:456 start_codon:yes stop_codon:yes gene_type:complete